MQFRKRRKTTHFTAELTVNRARFELLLVDVTPTGVKLEGAHDVVDGTAGVLTVRGRSFPGTLRWVTGRRVGFQFDEKLPADIYATLARERLPARKRRRVVFD